VLLSTPWRSLETSGNTRSAPQRHTTGDTNPPKRRCRNQKRC